MANPFSWSGLRRITTAWEYRAIKRAATSIPTMSLSSILRHLPVYMDAVVYRHMLRAEFVKGLQGMSRAKARVCMIGRLTIQHRRCTLDWSGYRATLAVFDWRNLIFSDEYRFYLSACDSRMCVGREACCPVQHLLLSGTLHLNLEGHSFEWSVLTADYLYSGSKVL